jgi:hypothetical protein
MRAPPLKVATAAQALVQVLNLLHFLKVRPAAAQALIQVLNLLHFLHFLVYCVLRWFFGEYRSRRRAGSAPRRALRAACGRCTA